MGISQDTFRQVLGTFCTGVTIVTFKSNNTSHGLTVNAFSSLSLDPALILICIKKDGVSHKMLQDTNSFVVNILSEKQKDLARHFANSNLSSDERFNGVTLKPDTPDPVFVDNLSYLACKIVNRFDGGDHSIFIGEVQEAGINGNERPLLYYRSEFPKI